MFTFNVLMVTHFEEKKNINNIVADDVDQDLFYSVLIYL